MNSMNKLSMTNINSLDRLEWEHEHNLPMTPRERLLMNEVVKLRKEVEDERKKTMAKDRSRVDKTPKRDVSDT